MEQMLQFSFPHFAEVTLLQVKIGIFKSYTLTSSTLFALGANDGRLCVFLVWNVSQVW